MQLWASASSAILRVRLSALSSLALVGLRLSWVAASQGCEGGREGWQADTRSAGVEPFRVDLCHFMEISPDMFRLSRNTLTERGNIASSVFFDALARLFDEGSMTDVAGGLIAGFGPGITAGIGLGRWNAGSHPDEKLSATSVRPLRGRPG